MDFMLMDTSGNAIDSYPRARDAEAALIALVDQDPSAAEEVALIAFDRRGVAVGEPVVVADLRPELAVELELEGEGQTRNGLTVLAWGVDVVLPLAEGFVTNLEGLLTQVLPAA
jgi:hypothetical protein